jgi:hypothetical protein
MTLESGAGVGDFNERRSNNDTVGFPADPRIWESVIAVPDLAKQIIDDVVTFSAPFGTVVDFKDGIGSVRVGGTKSNH